MQTPPHEPQTTRAIDKAAVRALTTLTMAAADGLFIAHEIDRDDVNFESAFELLAAGILGAAEHLRSRIGRSSKETRQTARVSRTMNDSDSG